MEKEDLKIAAPFVGLVASVLVSWATGWLNALEVTGLAHPNFDESHRKIAAVIGVVFCLVIVALWRKSNVSNKKKVAWVSAGCLVLSFLVTLMFSSTIDYATEKDTIVLLRKIWALAFLVMNMSLLTTIAATSLFWHPEER